ncbi:hypothetical protein D3C75_1342070 [compost metagenome]
MHPGRICLSAAMHVLSRDNDMDMGLALRHFPCCSILHLLYFWDVGLSIEIEFIVLIRIHQELFEFGRDIEEGIE